MLTKQCTECGKVLPATDKHFTPQAAGKYGYISKCKPCRAALSRDYYANNKEAHLAAVKRWRDRHREQYLMQQREYFAERRQEQGDGASADV